MGRVLSRARLAMSCASVEAAESELVDEYERLRDRRALRQNRRGGCGTRARCPSCLKFVANRARPCDHCGYHGGWHR